MTIRGVFQAVFAFGLLCLAGVSGPAPAAAQSKTIDFAALQKITDGLGLQDSGDKKTYIRFENQGSQNYTISLTLADEQTAVLIYVYLADVPTDKAIAGPLEKLLEYNDVHPDYFTIGDQDDRKLLYLQYRLTAPTVTPQTLRASLDGLLAAANDTKDLWTTDKWAPTASATAPVAAKTLSIAKAMFVEQPTSSYGNYQKRATNVFLPGEKLMSYIEPSGYDYKSTADGTYDFGFSIDLSIKDKAGASIGQKADFSRQVLTSHEKVKEFFLNLTLALNGIPPGDYVLAYTLHDIASSRTAVTEQPFTIKDAAK